MDTNYKMQGGKIHNKVKGGAAGGGIGLAITVLLMFVYKKVAGEELPLEVGMAVGSIITWATSSFAAWLTPPAKNDIPVPENS